jgi:hypothetical protein
VSYAILFVAIFSNPVIFFGAIFSSAIFSGAIFSDHHLTDNVVNSVFFDLVTDTEVKEIIDGLRCGIASGYDEIPMWLVKSSSKLISSPLKHVINISINSGIVPDQTKIARILPLFKSGDNRVFSNYRPVSVLPIFSKVFEKVVYNRLFYYFNKSGILFQNQFGFRKGHSTSLAFHHLYDKITAAIDQRKFTVCIFLDLSKAFDTLNHAFYWTNWSIMGFMVWFLNG